MGPYEILIIPLVGILMLENAVYGEISVYPGLRRKPVQSSSVLQQQFDIPPDFLAQLMEENARRRLQQQFEQQLDLINMQMSRQRDREESQHQNHHNQDHHHHHHQNHHNQHRHHLNKDVQPDGILANENPNAVFTYKFSNGDEVNNNINGNHQDTIPFAVNPSDPRYYAENTLPSMDSYEEYEPPETKQSEISKNLDTTTTFHRIKPQSSSAVSTPTGTSLGNVLGSNVHGQNDINALLEKLQNEGNSAALDTARVTDEHVVLRQHLGIDGDMGMYVVALVAGISAAITVGLIALGVAWYTFQNKSKAAADVEYPAYGVTGPNKDISPSSGDRRLAQSAQMYHYQHQKQQIIAMENRQAVEGQCGLSDVESDDDNEEGDYTVYECPGLAPTGEMEVKNPLFLDDTPVTPAGIPTPGTRPAVAKLTQSPQKQSQAGTRKPQVKTVRSSDENKKKNRK